MWSCRFQSVTDRFLHELAPLANGQVARDGDAKFENLVLGLRHVEINVRRSYSPGNFNETNIIHLGLADRTVRTGS